MKSLIVAAQFTQDHEFIYPFYRLKEESFEVITALKNGKHCTGFFGTNIPPDKDAIIIDYESINIDEYDLLVIPGGAKCMEYLRQEQDVLDFISLFNEKNKVIASICHGAQMLISARVVKGRKISGYYSIKDDIINAGAEYVDAPAVIDNNIISCPHYKYLGDWMKATLGVLRERSINS
jgi:protease I